MKKKYDKASEVKDNLEHCMCQMSSWRRRYLFYIMLFTDVLEHLQNLNFALQGKEGHIVDWSQIVFYFKAKLQVYINN